MARTAILAIKIIADATSAAKTLNQTGGGVGKFEKGLATASTAAKTTILAIAGLGAAAAKQASDLQQSSGAVAAVFGENAAAVEAAAKSAAQNVGLAQSEYQQSAATLGAALSGLGVAAGDLAPTTDKLITAGADLAATFGGSTADAVDALGAAMRGETDPIEKYGISIKQADVNAKMAAQGTDKLTGKARKQAETQARLALITEQSAKAQGQFGREADTAAGQQARASAQMKNAMAALGAVLLPIISKAAELFGKLAKFVQDNAKAVQILVGVIAALAGVVLAVNAAMTVYKTIQTAMAIGTKIAAAGQWLLNAAMSANPIGIIIIAVIALVAGLVLLYKKSATFRAIVQAVGKAGVAAFRAVVGAVKTAWAWLGAKLGAAIRTLAAGFRLASTTARAAFAAVAAVIQRVITANVRLAAILRGAVAGAFRAVKSVATSVFHAISSAIRSVLSTARSVASSIAATFAAAFARIKSAGKSAADTIMRPFRELHTLIGNIIGAIGRIHFPSPPSWLNKAIKGPTTSSALLVGPSTRAGTATTTTSTGGGGVTINVSGALDPEGVARQIQTILGGAARRRRGTARPLRAGAA